VQIEINRALYLDERTVTPTAGLAVLARALSDWIGQMGRRTDALPSAAE
jgi:N-formylglutamate amidohydrolase